MGCGPSQDVSNNGNMPIGRSGKPTAGRKQRITVEQTHQSTYQSAEDANNLVSEIIRGNVEIECPPNTKIVRIFTSSTFTDTEHERNALMERVYPKLKKFCQERGYEFQVVDMRWGIRDEATDDHMGTELCLREIEACQKLSSGPNFVTFLSQRYGTRLLPRKIDADEFESIVSHMPSEDGQTLLNSWYKKDENEIPTVYVLQKISTNLPEYKSSSDDTKRQAKATWWSVSERLRRFLSQAAEKVFRSDSRANKYKYSVTEHELNKGIMEVGNPDKKCLWFHRILTDVDDNESEDQRLLARYVESGDSEDDAKELLDSLKTDKIVLKLPKDSILTYNVNWTEKGIDPRSVAEHEQYINQLCQDFETKMKERISDGMAGRVQSAITDPLYEEISQHVTFCQDKCEAFQGRENVLKPIESYLTSNNSNILVLHGMSGCGKTSIVAMAAKMVRRLVSKDAVVILRFLGTTPDSCNIRRLLYSVCRQISKAYDDEEDTPDALKMLIRTLPERLDKATKERPLVILLDSLDQFDAEGEARKLSWLPLELPDHVKLIVSTLPEKEYECFPILQSMLDQENFLEIPKLEESDSETILQNWLELQNRRLTNNQMDAIVQACHHCPLPLFLKISFDEACRWSSYSNPEETRLKSTVRDVIVSLFERVEMQYGDMLVSRALGYLTAGKNGLTENELEDILSLDDDVLNDVYQYWTPPIRRLPPLLWVRIRAELSSYLVDRGADGVRVISWYHRQFKEAAQQRYLPDQKTRQLLHANIADFFLGIWSDGKKKPYTTRGGKKGESDRLVASQPLVFGEASYNLRKLSELPFHLMQSEQLQSLKDNVILYLDWLYIKMKATSLRHVFDDFRAATAKYPDDSDIRLVFEVLQLSQEALLIDPNQLASQILARVVQTAKLRPLVSQAQNPKFTSLLPSFPFLTPPGGPLLRTVTGHKDNMIGLDISWDGKLAITAGADNSVKLWDVESGFELKTLEDVGDEVHNLKFCYEDKFFAVSFKGAIKVYQSSNGSQVMLLYPDGKSSTVSVPFAVGGESSEKLFVPCQGVLKVIDLKTESIVKEVSDEFLQEKHWSCYIQANGYVVAYYNTLLGRKMNLLQVVDMSTEPLLVRTVEPYPKTKTPGGVFQTHPINALVITDDKIVVSNMIENGLKIYDIKSLELLKFIEGSRRDMSARFHLTRDMRYITFPNRGYVCTWDLITEKRSNNLEHPFPIYNTATVDGHRIVTIGMDNLMRIWDASRDDPDARLSRRDWDSHRSSQVSTLAADEEKERELFADLWTIPGDERHIIAYSKQRTGDDCAVTVWDTVTCKPMTRTAVKSAEGLRWSILDQNHAIGVVGQRIKIINYVKGNITKVFHGKTGGEWVCLVKNRTEIVAVTQGGRNLKIMDVETGKPLAILRHGKTESRNSNPVLYFSSNSDGCGMAVCSILEDEPLTWYIWDIQTRALKCTLNAPGTPNKSSMVIRDSTFTSNSAYFCCKYRESPDVINTEVNVWNTHTGELTRRLKNEKGGSVVSVVAMGNDKLIVSYCERSIDIIVWNLTNGEQLQRLPGHSFRHVNQILPTENHRHLLSYQSLSAKEREFILWNLEKGTKIAGFTVEENSVIELVQNGNVVVLAANSIGSIVTFTLHGDDVTKFEMPREELSTYKEAGEENVLELVDQENDDKDDSDDLDSDFDLEEDES
ncbi:NACHT domain- and WD repeat-containing protein 1-like [Glandiceps talaboti]